MKSEDQRDETLGLLLKEAAEGLSRKGDPDFDWVRGHAKAQGSREGFRLRPHRALPLAAAAVAAIAFASLLQQGSNPGGGKGLLYSREISLLSRDLVGYHSRPIFSGAIAAAGEATDGRVIPSVPAAGELSNFVADLWNREGI